MWDQRGTHCPVEAAESTVAFILTAQGLRPSQGLGAGLSYDNQSNCILPVGGFLPKLMVTDGPRVWEAHSAAEPTGGQDIEKRNSVSTGLWV